MVPYCKRTHKPSALGVKFLCFIFTFRRVELYFSTLFHPNINAFEVKPQEVTQSIYQNKCNTVCWLQPKVHLAQCAIFDSSLTEHTTLTWYSSSIGWNDNVSALCWDHIQHTLLGPGSVKTALFYILRVALRIIKNQGIENMCMCPRIGFITVINSKNNGKTDWGFLKNSN